MSVVYNWSPSSTNQQYAGSWTQYWSSSSYTIQGMSDSGRLIVGVRFRNPSYDEHVHAYTSKSGITPVSNNASLTYLSEIQIFNAGLNFDNGKTNAENDYEPWGHKLEYKTAYPVVFHDLAFTRDGCFFVLATSMGVKVYGSNERLLPFSSMPTTYKERIYAMKDARHGIVRPGGA